MKITTEELKASYRRMSDDELLELDREHLTDVARQCYDQEVESRGLQPADEAEDSHAAAAPLTNEPMVVVQNCASTEEAWSLHSALEAAGIPSRPGGESDGQFPVAVPASYAEQAKQVLNAELPEAIVIPARFQNGVFVPVEDVDLPEGTLVEVHVPAEALGGDES